MPHLSLPRPSRPAPRLPTREAPQPDRREKEKPVIGEYVIERTLGYGSFGKVKLARHKLTGHYVAMKFISRRKMSTVEMQNRVEREIQYLGLLQHPHIIKLYDVIPTRDYIVMVIEYLNGELFDYIVNNGRMSEAQARRFFQQLIAAVEYCHSHSIVHRDLKPENLLLDDQLNLKIADFGLSNVMRDGDFLKTSCGSPNYAAPEVISGKLYAGPEIDIWSCGVILYVMLCGRLPFDDEHIPLLFKKINGGIYSLPPYLSPDARHILQKMLIVDSTKRIRLSEIRKHPWFQKDLPSYLQVSYDDDDESESEAPAVPEKPDEVSVPEDASKVAWIHGVGFVEESVVDDLCSKIPGLTSEDVWSTLEGPPSRENRELIIAYKLCRDNRQSKSEPPPTNPLMNIRTPVVHKQKSQENEMSTNEEVELEPVSTLIRILETSLSSRGEALMEGEERPNLKPTMHRPLLSGDVPQPMTQATIPASRQAPGNALRRPPRVRWHFGIRSRSPPMEVMLEIYRTLKALGFEWKKKQDITISAEKEEGEEDPKARKKREEEIAKAATDLYFVATRCRVGDVMVRMDIQLYCIDPADPQNYLVDFRHVGDTPVKPISKPMMVKPAEVAKVQNEEDSGSGTPEMASSLDSSPSSQQAPPPSFGRPRDPGVSNPFLFLETSCRLILELAVGSG